MARGKKTGGGSRKGVPNRATADARAAIGKFVDGNAHRLQGWLDTIAEGVKGTDKEGKEYWLVMPRPERAYELFQSVIEYHVPKLQRTDINAKLNDDGEALMRVEFLGPKKSKAPDGR